MRIHPLTAALLTFVTAVLLTACYGENAPRRYVVQVGDPARGAALIQAKDCGSCHTIPGISGARGVVGPPLYFWARRTYIAGRVPNQPENLVRWIENPMAIDPETAMPNLELTDQQARNVAAYLYTLY